MKRKTDLLLQKTDEHEKIKEQKVDQLTKEKDEIIKEKVDYEAEIEKITGFIEQEEQEREKRNKEEEERLEKLEREKQLKIEMEDAARHIQKKWEWF
mmetsp:Transcript_32276/g.31567  ORF Transcript_32276/g.31567 Transcript_32276/m.31567 type:complete len:97 (-) Transcript_32276:104-394(-)